MISGAIQSAPPVAIANPIIFGKLATSDTTQEAPEDPPDFTVDAASGTVSIIGTQNVTFTGATLFAGYSAGVSLDNGVNAVQTLNFGGSSLGGTFTLSFNGFTTDPITYDTSAATLEANIQAALDNLSFLTGNTVVDAISPTNVTVTFQGVLGKQNVPPMVANSSLTGTNPTISVSSTTLGRGGLQMAGIIAGKAHFTKEGVATLRLSRGNTYTGVTIVDSGIVTVETNDALGSGGTGEGVVVRSGATMQFYGVGDDTGYDDDFFFEGGSGVGGFGAVHNLSSQVGDENAIDGNSFLRTSILVNGDVGIFSFNGDVDGPADITKLGTHTMRSAGDNSGFTGQLNVNQGIFVAQSNAGFGSNIAPIIVADGATFSFDDGATYSGKNIFIQGQGFGLDSTGHTLNNKGPFFPATGDPATWTGDITLLSDTRITIDTSADTITISGRISGNFGLTISGDTVIILQAPASYTGPTVIDSISLAGGDNATSLRLTGSGTLLNTSSILIEGSSGLTIDNRTTFIPDRVGDSIPIEINSGALTYLGSNTAFLSTSEAIGTVNNNRGHMKVFIDNGAGNNASSTLTIDTLLRQTGATATFDSTRQPLGTALARIFVTNAPTLTNDIVPYATWVNTGANTIRELLTYGVDGFAAFANYIVNPTQAALANLLPTDNVKFTTGIVFNRNVTVNSMLVQGSNAVQLSSAGNQYTLNLGVSLVTTGGGTATFTGGTIDFGTSEGIILNNTNLTIGSIAVPTVLAGTNGMTMGGQTGNNTLRIINNGAYTGNSIFNGSGTRPDDVPNDDGQGYLALGSLGSLGNTTLLLQGGSVGVTGQGNFGVLANNIVINNAYGSFGHADGRLVVTGAIEIIGKVYMGAPVNTVYVRSPISGSGSLVLNRMGHNNNVAVILEGNNTYTGGTFIGPGGGSEMGIASDTAFGTGPVHFLGGQIALSRALEEPTAQANANIVTIANPFFLTNTEGEARVASVQSNVFQPTQSVVHQTLILTGLITVTGTSELRLDSPYDMVLSGGITGPGALTLDVRNFVNPHVIINDPAHLTISAASTLTGGISFEGTNVNLGNSAGGGTVVLTHPEALGPGLFSMAGGTLEALGHLTIANPMILQNNATAKFFRTPTTNDSFTFTGAISGNASYTKIGLGKMTITNLDTRSHNTTILEGELALSGGGALTGFVAQLTGAPATNAAITIGNTGILTLDNAVTNNSGRLPNPVPVIMVGGTLNVIGNNAAGTNKRGDRAGKPLTGRVSQRRSNSTRRHDLGF